MPVRSIPIVFGSTYSGNLNQTQGLFRAYTFTAQAGDTVLARLAVGLSDTVPGKFWLYAPNGTLLDELRPDMGNYNERLKTLPGYGTYTLVVGVHGPSEPMLFSIYIQRVNNPTGSDTY